MHYDMHYYGVYALARAAGLKSDIALRIAEASQYVDEFCRESPVPVCDGKHFIPSYPTAHGMYDNDNLCDVSPEDQRLVWVPFHFMPGGEGVTPEERLVCRKDSKIVNALIEYVISRADELYAPELVGIMAHIYADTFAHYGFTGTSAAFNAVNVGSIQLDVRSSNVHDYVKKKAQAFFDKISAAVAGGIACNLGHSAVASYPDRPYLKWQFKYLSGAISERDNVKDYCEATIKLHELFVKFAKSNTAYAAQTRAYSLIADVVTKIIKLEGAENERINAWQSAAQVGLLYEVDIASSGGVPPYENKVANEITQLNSLTPEKAIRTRIAKFIQAAEVIRAHVLYELLPANGLMP